MKTQGRYLATALILIAAIGIANAEGMDLTDNVLVLYNENTLDAKGIAEYYANARGIGDEQICPIKLPAGQFATADQLLGARKTIVEKCICKSVAGKLTGPCVLSNINEIAAISPITHLAIVRGIPPRLTGTGWTGDEEEASLDYYLSLMLYSDYDNFFEENETGRFLPYSNYYGENPNPVDSQTAESTKGYVRSMDPALDRIVAYGRIEAITKERTFELIDRTIEAEEKGVSGNFLIAQRHTTSFTTEGKLYDFLTNLTSSSSQTCTDYLQQPYGAWPFETCRLGVNPEGRVPGETGGSILQPINAGIYLGNHHGTNDKGNTKNQVRAFDGFGNMLNWRKSDAACTPLCKDTANPDACRQNSKDYFKEINTDCVGVADGFLGWQLISWPVQYYGFWPAGWSQISGGNGQYEKTPPVILEGGAYQDSLFTDDKYLHFGALDAAASPECILANGSIEACNEMIGVNLRQSISLKPQIYIDGTHDFKVRFRHRNPQNTNAKLKIRLFFYLDDGTLYSISSRYVDLSEAASKWKTDEVVIRAHKDGKNITQILLDVSSSLSSSPLEWLELDAFELIDMDTGENLLDVEEASFNAPQIGYTQAGDYASNAIDRLGGIAFWGSSSHFLTGGYAFNYPYRFVGAFYSGRSLGESLAHNGGLGMSAIIYGDPLYRPSGAKIYVNDGVNELNSEDSGYTFLPQEISTSKVYVNAFHGKGNLNTTNWSLSVCYSDSVDNCAGKWSEIQSDTKAAFGLTIFDSLEAFVADPGSSRDFIMKLRVWNPGNAKNDLTNYAFFHYRLDIDSDGLLDEWEKTHFGNLLSGAEDDPDQDGFWNIEEYKGGTNPSSSGIGQYPRCYLERHCPDFRSVCLNYTCTECTEDTHCQGTGKPFCLYNTCRECTEDTHCQGTGKPICSIYQCVECIEDRHCEGKQGLPYCVMQKCVECISNENCTGKPGLPYCLFNSCVECKTRDECTGEDYCWLDGFCKSISCDKNSDCEDFDDCSLDECVSGYCKFTKFESEENCYYCADFSSCNSIGGMNICGGPDIDRNGSVGGQGDFDILIEQWMNEPCTESNLFCNYADIDRSIGRFFPRGGLFVMQDGVNSSDFIILQNSDGDNCNIEPGVACQNCLPEQICCSGTCVNPTCSQNDDCGAGHFCSQAGTCKAQCVMGCQTEKDCLEEEICCGGACTTAACNTDADCDDLNAATTDTCTQAGSCNANCINTLITECIDGDGYCPPECNANTDNDCIEACGNGQVDAGENCANCPQDVACAGGTICCGIQCTVPQCSANSDCDDADDCTTDTCNNPGQCTAACSNTAITGCGTQPGPTPGPGGGGGGGGGGSGAKLIVKIEGTCVGQSITVNVLNERGNPAAGATVKLVRNRRTLETKRTSETGKLSFIIEEEGEYIFYTTKPNHYSDNKRLQATECKPPTINFETSLETGQTQTITLTAEDGNTIRDFNVLLTSPGNATALLEAKDGVIILPTEEAGTYTVTVKTTGFETTINFEATKPMQVIPNISPTARPAVEAVFGQETVETPNYLIIWILAIAMMSGLIIEVTKLKPGWFRVFMATTYTALPLVVNYYTKNIWAAFAIIAIQTIILTASWFKQWKLMKPIVLL